MKQRTLLLATPNSPLFDRVDWQLCGELHVVLLPRARNESEALSLVRERHPDVALLDFCAFAENAAALIDRVAAESPATKSLLFWNAWTERSIMRALRSGGDGCVNIDGPCSEIIDAMDAVQRGEIWVSRRTLSTAFRQLLSTTQRSSDAAQFHGRLSLREREIVGWVRHGMSNKQIARELGISDMTVKTHVHNIFHKLEISGRLRLMGMPPPAAREA
ncbi:MAG TPA: response regulator transcription factor [Casimicrobiaceae bacterium]|nr:response regulator transcription factor [Casimicrobiaceae bacterium]